MKQNQYVTKPMNERNTPRKCVECGQPAGWFRYKVDQPGPKHKGLDESSRQPVCGDHAL